MTIYKLILLIIHNLTFQTSQPPQTMSPEQVVQKQLDTYNARDIEGFMSVMDEDVALYNFSDGELLAKGKANVKRSYANLFKNSPQLKSILTNRIVLGHQVIDHESITGRMGNSEVLELVVIYQVRSEKIYQITVMRK